MIKRIDFWKTCDKTIEWFGLGGTFTDHLNHPSCNEQGHIQLHQILRALFNIMLNISKGGASTTSLGNLCQCFTTLIVKNFFLISYLNLLYRKSPSPSFLSAPFKYWKAAIRSLRSLLFSRLNSPNSLSLSSQERCSTLLIMLAANCAQESLNQIEHGKRTITFTTFFLYGGFEKWYKSSSS